MKIKYKDEKANSIDNRSMNDLNNLGISINIVD